MNSVAARVRCLASKAFPVAIIVSVKCVENVVEVVATLVAMGVQSVVLLLLMLFVLAVKVRINTVVVSGIHCLLLFSLLSFSVHLSVLPVSLPLSETGCC